MKQFIETLDVAIDNLKELKRQAKEIFKPKPKLKLDDWVFVQLIGNEHLGFSVQKIIFDHSLHYFNSPTCPHSCKKISYEDVERIRKEFE